MNEADKTKEGRTTYVVISYTAFVKLYESADGSATKVYYVRTKFSYGWGDLHDLFELNVMVP